MFEGVLGTGILARAIKKGLVKVKIHNLRKWAWNKYGAVDDRPYGGGAGMVIRPDVVGKGLDEIGRKGKIIALSAKGKRLRQSRVEKLAKEKRLVLVCGHYEGFDQRTLEEADEVISIGDYVLMGGEVAAMVVIEAVSRLVKGVLGKEESSREESFSRFGNRRIIEYPQYTRPEVYKDKRVPKVLLSGDHQKIRKWRLSHRPDV